MSLATAGIYCTVSPPLSDAMEDYTMVWVQQLQMLCHRRCCMSASERMFGGLYTRVYCVITVLHMMTYAERKFRNKCVRAPVGMQTTKPGGTAPP